LVRYWRNQSSRFFMGIFRVQKRQPENAVYGFQAALQEEN
jgi:hypothetical protein